MLRALSTPAQYRLQARAGHWIGPRLQRRSGQAGASLLVVAAVLLPAAGRAQDIIYSGRDLQLPVKRALAEMQQSIESNDPATGQTAKVIADDTSLTSIMEPDQITLYGNWRDLDCRAAHVTQSPLTSARLFVISCAGQASKTSPEGSRPIASMSVGMFAASPKAPEHLADLLATVSARLDHAAVSAPGDKVAENDPAPDTADGETNDPSNATDPAQPDPAPVADGAEAASVAAASHDPMLVVGSIDHGAHALGTQGGANYVHLSNTAKHPITLSAWTEDCVHIDSATCGPVLSNVRLQPGADIGFWVNRDGGDNVAWSYTVSCAVDGAAPRSCNVNGGGGQQTASAATP